MLSMNKILFYIEPWVELSEDFRLGNYAHYNYLAENLKKVNNQLEVRFILSDALYQQILTKKPAWLNKDIYTIELKELEKIYPDYHVATYNNYHKPQLIDNSKQKLADIVKQSLKDNWTPDIILMHETHAPFLQCAFPDALVLHTMYGMTFKEPYPQTYLFDYLGLYSNSIFNQRDILSDITISDNDRKNLYKIKNWYAQQIVPHDPVWGIIEKYQSQYDKLILLPLQVDGYYAFTECSEYQTQIDFLKDVLEKTPKEWGVIVTGHSNYGKMVSKKTFLNLKLQHENLIQLDELDKIPYVSQALLPHVDAIVSVSSSLALQSLIFNKPLIVAGFSHINKIATCSLKDIQNVFKIPYDELKNFKVLKFFFLKYHLLHKRKVEDFSAFYQYLSAYYNNFLQASDKLEVQLPDIYLSLEDYFDDLIQSSQWRMWDNLLISNKIKKKVNPVFLDIVFHDLISWDLFDTLVDRPFIHPHELFQAIEDIAKYKTNNVYLPFHMIRRESERLARAINARREINYNEIYQCLKSKTYINRQHLNTLKKLEIEAELSCVKPRRIMKRTWEFAGVLGKVRSIITDIYLNKKVIEKILEKNGFANYHQLFISSEDKVRKEDGSVYPEYLEKTKNKFGDGKFLHIGDNPKADGSMAKQFGITAHVIPKALEQLQQSYYAKLYDKPLRYPSYDSSIIIGMIANKFFSSPKSHFNKAGISNNELYNLGYSIVGPFLLSYVQWVIRRLKSHQVDKVYFLARDGYLIMQVYNLFQKTFKDLPAYKYLLCSRRGVTVPSIFNEDNILETAMLNYGVTTVKNFLSTRFGLEMEQVPKSTLTKYKLKADGSTKIHFPDDLSISNGLVIDIQDIIFKKAQEERELYNQYLLEEGIYDDCKIAFVDIGYSGTMQRKIKNITNKSFVGLYMLTHNYVLPYFRDEVFEGWLESYDNQRSSIRNIFNDYIPLLESMLSSDAGSFINFYIDEQGKRQVNYLLSKEEASRCYFVKSIQKGAIDFVQDFILRFDKLALDIEISATVGSHLMFEFGKNPSTEDVKLFEGLLLENMFAGSEFNVIASPQHYLDTEGKLNNNSYNYLLQLSKWKQGANVAYQKYLKQKSTISQSQTIQEIKQIKEEKEEVEVIKVDVHRPTGLTRYERLQRKLRENPKLFIEDLKLLPEPIKKVIVNNNILFGATRLVFQEALKYRLHHK